MAKLEKITIQGFKSIRKLEDFRIGDINVLIGANGAGKSNFVQFLIMLHMILRGQFQHYTIKNGPLDGFFFNGIKSTPRLEAAIKFSAVGLSNLGYNFAIEPAYEKLILIDEELFDPTGKSIHKRLGWGFESEFYLPRGQPWPYPKTEGYQIAASWMSLNICPYHFHDTSMLSGMRRESGVNQTHMLFPHGDNLAAFLYGLSQTHFACYDDICDQIKRVAPYFESFDFQPKTYADEDRVSLKWRKRDTDHIFSPGHFSDGTMRFICLATALLQPDPPSVIIIDEPEIGLHPEALAVFAGLVRSVSHKTQIILATQSPALVSEFEPDQIITVDHIQGATRFRRFDPKPHEEWLRDYSLGDLWQKGHLEGVVQYE